MRQSSTGELGRTPTKDCYALKFEKSGNAEWTLYNSFTENLNYLGRSPLRTTAVFLPRYGTYIFGGFSSQFLLAGTSEWQKGMGDKILISAFITCRRDDIFNRKLKKAYL